MRYLVYFFLLFATTITAQTNLEGLIQKLETVISSKDRIDVYHQIGKLTRGENNEVYIKYTTKLIDLAIEIKEYDIAAQKSLDLFGVYRNHNGETEKALKVLEKIQKYENQLKDSQNIGGLYKKFGGYYYSGNDFEKAIENYSLAIEKYGEKNDVQKADATFFRGQAYSFLGDFINAIEDYETAIKAYEKADDILYVNNVKQSMALLYSTNGFTKEAEKLLTDVLNYALKGDNELLKAIVNYNLALLYKKNTNSEKEEKALLESKKHYENAKTYKYQIVVIQCALAEFHALQGNITKASAYLSKAETTNDVLKTNKRMLSYYYNAKVIIEKSLKNYDEALNTLNKSQELAIEWKNITQQIQNQKLFYELYLLKGNKDKAYSYFEKYTKGKDSVSSVQKTNTLLYYQNKYESERKERNIKDKEASIKLLEKDNVIKKNWLIFGSIGLVLFFCVLYLIREKYYSDKSKKTQKEYSQNLILAQEEERKRIASDLHDGIGQQLLLIKNQSIIDNMKEIMSIANQTIDEVRTISHNLHPYQLQEFGLTKAIKMNLKKFKKSTSSIFVSYEIDDIDNLLNDPEEINIYRIIQECIANIVKHAEATAAKIELKKTANNIQITVNDNGIGYDATKEFSGNKSLGLKTLKERVHLMKGTMAITSEKNKGTKIEFIIPLK